MDSVVIDHLKERMMCESGNCGTCESKSECCDFDNHAGFPMICYVCGKKGCDQCMDELLNDNEWSDNATIIFCDKCYKAKVLKERKWLR